MDELLCSVMQLSYWVYLYSPLAEYLLLEF